MEREIGRRGQAVRHRKRRGGGRERPVRSTNQMNGIMFMSFSFSGINVR